MPNTRNIPNRFRRWTPFALLGLVIATGSRLTAAEPSPSALESDPAGWIDLLPPADLKGWSRVPVPPGAPLGRAQWHVEEAGRVLVCDGDGGHNMLLCDREFGDAVFHFEFRYTKVEGKTGYNSGAYVRNSPGGAIWHQAQFGDASAVISSGKHPARTGKRSSSPSRRTRRAAG
jgi:hypothetical protein